MTSLAESIQGETMTASGNRLSDENGFVCHTKQAVENVKSAVRADVQEIQYFAEDYVIEHPLKVAGIALGVGFLLGVLWAR